MYRAHPRSRGENLWVSRSGEPSEGLIPAHAGKTCSGAGRRSACRAHPRSRGENRWAGESTLQIEGSSPLTRGKRLHEASLAGGSGLIPAHAGKTVPRVGAAQGQEAHPRSRGENADHLPDSLMVVGSSPLTRGKPLHTRPRLRPTRLIPAHAGKTSTQSPTTPSGTAHPRSRGENLRCASNCEYAQGSSPLTRGKRGTRRSARWGLGLIPAHAGKTEGG